MKSILRTLLLGGLIFISEALFLMFTEFLPQRPDIQWYLMGQGQIMVAVGAFGLLKIRKNKAEDYE